MKSESDFTKFWAIVEENKKKSIELLQKLFLTSLKSVGRILHVNFVSVAALIQIEN
jgi:hypothetical protein